MKKIFIGLALCFCFTIAPTKKSDAFIWAIVKEAVKKVIMAIDLEIQKQQNKVIVLQNAQKALENAMSKLKLKQIADWTEKQRKLYDDYFKELWKVKNAISTYKEAKKIVEEQKELLDEYKVAWDRLRHDHHFTPAELDEMYRVYSGIIGESLRNLDQLKLVINSFATQMSDGKRLELIHSAGKGIDENLDVLRSYNSRNFYISLSRAKTAQDAEITKELYGLK